MVQCRKISQRVIALIFLVALTSSTLGNAQDNPPSRSERHWWFNAGLGWGQYDATGELSIATQSRSLILSCRLAFSTEFSMFDGSSSGVFDTGILVGYGSKRPQLINYSIAAGLALASGHDFGPTIGLPVEAQVSVTPTSFMGVGITGFLDVNKDKTFYGLLICLQFGNLR